MQRGENVLFDLCKDGFENDPWNLWCWVVTRRMVYVRCKARFEKNHIDNDNSIFEIPLKGHSRAELVCIERRVESVSRYHELMAAFNVFLVMMVSLAIWAASKPPGKDFCKLLTLLLSRQSKSRPRKDREVICRESSPKAKTPAKRVAVKALRKLKRKQLAKAKTQAAKEARK